MLYLSPSSRGEIVHSLVKGSNSNWPNTLEPRRGIPTAWCERWNPLTLPSSSAVRFQVIVMLVGVTVREEVRRGCV